MLQHPKSPEVGPHCNLQPHGRIPTDALYARTKYQWFTTVTPCSPFKKLIMSTPRLLSNLHMMSLAKAVPTGLKDCKCKKFFLRECHPAQLVPLHHQHNLSQTKMPHSNPHFTCLLFSAFILVYSCPLVSPLPSQDIGWLLVSRVRLWTCNRNKLLFFPHIFSVPLHLVVLLFAHYVLFDIALGELLLTSFPCQSTWLCKVADVHKPTDVLFRLFVHGLSHHMSPFVVCSSVACTISMVVFFIQTLSVWMKEPWYIQTLAIDYRRQTFAVCREWKKHSNLGAQQ